LVSAFFGKAARLVDHFPSFSSVCHPSKLMKQFNVFNQPPEQLTTSSGPTLRSTSRASVAVLRISAARCVMPARTYSSIWSTCVLTSPAGSTRRSFTKFSLTLLDASRMSGWILGRIVATGNGKGWSFPRSVMVLTR